MRNSVQSRGLVAGGLLVAVLVAGCAAPMQPMGGGSPMGGGYGTTPAYGGYGNTAPAQGGTQYGVQYGQVQSIEVVRGEQAPAVPAGAVLGAVLGGVLGNQVGSGSGRAAATGAGVIGGALLGDRIQKSREPAAGEMVRVLVRFDNGSTRYFDYGQPVDLRVGDRVRVDNDRVTRY